MNDKLHKLILLNIMVFIILGALNAQISSKYSFTQATAIWQEIWGYYATDAMTDEGLSAPIDIGFTFPYGSNSYTQVKASSNGWLNLGTNLNSPYYANAGTIATLNLLPVVAPLWDDLSMNIGAVQYNSYGLAPHRIFIVQWLAARWNANGDNEYRFMVRLHETGQIDIIYGPHTGSPYNPSATIGINMAPGGTGNYYSILPGLPAQAFSNTTYDNLAVSHPSGTMYLFAPRSTLSQDASAVNLTGNPTPMHNVSTELLATFGNAGLQFTQEDSLRGYLMRGDDVLAGVNIPSIQPSGFTTISIPWVPDTTGTMQLYIKTVMSADTDSLNDKSYPFIINVQPFVSNDDQAVSPASNLLSCYPNPFQAETTIRYYVKEATPIKIAIYNLKGQKIKQLTDENKSAGSYSVKWDGTDDKGRAVSRGIYLCKMCANMHSETRKLFLMK